MALNLYINRTISILPPNYILIIETPSNAIRNKPIAKEICMTSLLSYKCELGMSILIEYYYSTCMLTYQILNRHFHKYSSYNFPLGANLWNIITILYMALKRGKINKAISGNKQKEEQGHGVSTQNMTQFCIGLLKL